MNQGLSVGDDRALDNQQMHQRLRQLLLMSQLNNQPQQQRQTLGLNPAQYPSLQAGQTGQQQQQTLNPTMLMYLMQMRQQQQPQMQQQQAQPNNNDLLSQIGNYLNGLIPNAY